jgi:heme-degrading monooxygenase HmoA
MMKIGDLDPSSPFMAQLHEKTGPIVLINTFIVPDGKMDEVLANWKDDAAFMKGCPGYISTQLHRGTGNSRLLVNVAVWQSTEALFAAFSDPDFQEKAHRYPDGVEAYPHILERVSVEGVCVA